MSKVAIAFGVLLAVLGGYLYLAAHPSPETGARPLTALIPAAFGVLLILCGVIAFKDNARKHAMHFAAMVGLVGLVMPLVMVIRKYASTGEFNPLSGGGQIGMAALCGMFLALCIKSFIDARKARKAAEAGR